jgi:hypothetical protein
MPTDVSLIGQVALKTDLRRLSDGCPIRSSKRNGINPKAGWVREVGIALTGYHVAVGQVSTVST